MNTAARFAISMALCIALASAALAQEKAKTTGGHDFVFLGEARPLFVRVHVRVDGKTLEEAYDDFIAHLFRHLDVKGKGFLDREEIERAPLPSQIQSGGLGSVFGGAFGYGRPPKAEPTASSTISAEKITKEQLAGFYRRHGLMPFQLQTEVKSADGGMMMMLGGAAPKAPGVEQIGAAVFALLDTRQKAALTTADLKATPEILLKLDMNEDEMITLNEIMPAATGKAYGDMQRMPKGNLLSKFGALPTTKTSETTTIFVLTESGDAPSGLVANMRILYSPPGTTAASELTRQMLGIDAATFKKLDANGDGVLDAQELAGFVKRTPDLEFVVHVGDARGVEIVERKDRPVMLADNLKAFDGLAMLDLPRSRVEFHGEGNAAGDSFAPLMRVQWMALFTQADKDKNGYLDAQEARTTTFANSFRAMDRDGDGKVTQQEFNAYLDLLQELHTRAKKACVSLVLTDESRGLFDLLDVNRDGRLSVREMRGASELVAKYGKGKGHITLVDLPKTYKFTVRSGPANAQTDDYAALLNSLYGGSGTSVSYREPTKGPLWFRKMDKNRDGDVSRREWLGNEELFRQIDTDSDGLISAAEAERFDARNRGP